MRVRWFGRVAAVAVLGILASPVDVSGGGRKNTRDFPANTVCPVNRGWFVDESYTIVPPPLAAARLPEHTFIAKGPAAKVTLVACDLGFGAPTNPGPDVLIRSFAVIRKDVYLSHQVDAAFYLDIGFDGENNGCNQEQSGEARGTRTIGSVFDFSVPPRVSSGTASVPFYDDFSNLAKSNFQWNLDGAVLKTANVNDPRSPSVTTARVLELSRTPPVGSNADSCSQASVWVFNLRGNQEYVVDYFWQSNVFDLPGELQMLTFVDTNPLQ